MLLGMVQNYTIGSMTNQKLSFIIDVRDDRDNILMEDY